MNITSLIHKQVESFILDQEDLDNPVLKTTSEIFLSSTAEGADLRTVDPETQARLEALLEAAGTFFFLFSFDSRELPGGHGWDSTLLLPRARIPFLVGDPIPGGGTKIL